MPYVGVVLMLSECVDFRYDVNGQIYEFSILGGGFVTLRQLVEVLGIAGSATSAENASAAGEEDTQAEKKLTLMDVEISDDTKAFVADVESVEFSDPYLFWIGKVDAPHLYPVLQIQTCGRSKPVR